MSNAKQFVGAQQPGRVFRSSPHQPGKKPAKKSLLASPGSLIVIAFGSLFVAYIFNVRGLATAIDRYFDHLNQAVQGNQQLVATVFIHGLPLIVGFMTLLLMLIFLRAGGGGKSAKPKSQSVESRGVDAFVETAAEQGISPRVARSAYRVLLPFVRKNKYLGVEDTLFHDLKMTEDQLSDIFGSLLRLSDRRRRSGDDGAGIRNVTGLMLAVEASEDKTAATVAGAQPRLISSQFAVASGPGPVPVPDAKPKKLSAVLVHPARLPRRELSMIRTRPLGEVRTMSAR